MINFVAFSINIIFPNNLEPKYEFYDFSPKPKMDLWQNTKWGKETGFVLHHIYNNEI